MLSSQKKTGFSPFLRSKSKVFFFILTLVLGCAVLFSRLDFQVGLSDESYGRDLYGFQETLNKKAPHRDYAWTSGPLLPYPYALIFRVAGPSIQSAILGHSLLTLLNGILIFLIASCLSVPSIAFGCATSYWASQNTFFFSEMFPGYTAAEGLFFFLLFLTFFVKTIQTQVPLLIMGTYLSLLLLLLSNLSLGIFLFGLFVICEISLIFFKNSPYRVYQCWVFFFLTVLTILMIPLLYSYYLPPSQWLDINASSENIQARLPFLARILGDEQGRFGYPLFKTLWGSSYLNAGVVFLTWLILQVHLKLSKAARHENKIKPILFLLLSLALTCSAHYLISGNKDGLIFCLPLLILLFFLHLDLGTRSFSIIRAFLLAAFICIPLFLIYRQHTRLIQFKQPPYLFHYNKNLVFTLEFPEWLKTMTTASKYIEENTKKADTLFVTPPTSMIYFLTGKSIPARALDRIGTVNEEEIIASLKQNQVAYIAIFRDPRSFSKSAETVSPSLARYLLSNYQEVFFFKDLLHLGHAEKGVSIKIFKRMTRPLAGEPQEPIKTNWMDEYENPSKARWTRDELIKKIPE